MAKALVQKQLEAIKLRQRGNSYSQIKSLLGVSKSTLSLWLRSYPLSEERIRELRDFNSQRIERYRNTMRHKHDIKMQAVYGQEKQKLLPLSKRELYLAGLLLYWGEGGKTKHYEISLSNTNPELVKFFFLWLIHVLQVPKDKIVVRLHLYNDMNASIETEFWGQLLGLPPTQFKRPYIKKTTLRGLTYKGFGHGTCNLIVRGGGYHNKVIMGIKVVCDGFIGK